MYLSELFEASFTPMSAGQVNLLLKTIFSDRANIVNLTLSRSKPPGFKATVIIDGNEYLVNATEATKTEQPTSVSKTNIVADKTLRTFLEKPRARQLFKVNDYAGSQGNSAIGGFFFDQSNPKYVNLSIKTKKEKASTGDVERDKDGYEIDRYNPKKILAKATAKAKNAATRVWDDPARAVRNTAYNVGRVYNSLEKLAK